MVANKLARCYELYRGQIQHEDMLLNQRVTWIVTSQAFLLGTYVFLLNSPLFYASVATAGSHSLASCDNIVFDASAFVDTIKLARRVFQVVGLCSSVATCVSSMAAVLAVRRLVGLYGRHLIAVESGEYPGERRDMARRLSQAEVAAAVSRIHEREGLPALVTRRLYSMMGLAASVFFGPVFAGAWVVLILPSQHLAVALSLIILLLLLVLAGLLTYKPSDWAARPARRSFNS